MRYWWVNHKQTFRHEFEGHYIWSPKRKRDGSRNRFYDFLRVVAPGDIVFSYASGAVQGAGFAVSYCYTCPRPAEFGHIGEAWDVVGWRVDVAFQRFSRPVRPKDHLVVLVPLIEQERFAPVRSTGDGLQHVYLTSISTAFAEVILGLAGERQRFSDFSFSDSHPLVERELAGQREWEDIEQRHILEADIPTTTRHALVQARIGQGLFKEGFRDSRKHVASRSLTTQLTWLAATSNPGVSPQMRKGFTKPMVCSLRQPLTISSTVASSASRILVKFLSRRWQTLYLCAAWVWIRRILRLPWLLTSTRSTSFLTTAKKYFFPRPSEGNRTSPDARNFV